jgi:hypothetical protein
VYEIGVRAVLTALLALLAVTLSRPAFADAKTEGLARASLKKAEHDYGAANFGAGAARIEKAMKACGANKCVAATRASLLCDLGTMQFRKGDTDQAARNWAEALKLQSDVALNPAYDTPDLAKAFLAAKRGTGDGGGDHGGAEPPAASDKNGESAADHDAENAGVAEAGHDDAPPEGAAVKDQAAFKRVWIGVMGALDFQSIPAGHDLCRLDPTTALPTNSANIYCTNRDGTDFPSRQSPAQNDALQPGLAGQSSGGIQRGDVRLALSFDYALTSNVLVGARAGVTLFKYTGEQAYTDGRAWSLASSRLYLDARLTYLFGADAITKTLAPMLFAGVGAASFDVHTGATVTLANGQSGPVNLWQTNGPFFFLVGGGIHLALGPSLAGTVAVRLNGSFGSNGFVPAFGPEVGLAYGF